MEDKQTNFSCHSTFYIVIKETVYISEYI